MKKIVLLFFLATSFSFSQTKVKDTVTRRATIGYDKKGNQVSLKAETPPLMQIAGAPTANYSYFWEFGDGTFSKEKEPKKVYKKKGEYKVNLAVTNNYDSGKPPKTRPKIVAVNEITDTNYSDIASLEDSISLKIFKNREPSPDEEMIVGISYKNDLNYISSGQLYLFYNEKEFKHKNFELLETRTHFGEREISENGIATANQENEYYKNIASSESNAFVKIPFEIKDEDLDMALLESKTLYFDAKVLEFDNMDANETRNMFFTFKTTPEMIKDTSATVKMRSIYVPDRNFKTYKKKTLEMEVVTSHDPNKMSSNATLINYRLVRLKTTNFKTRFQNDGEGPAHVIRLETDIPEMFDKKTLKIVDSYPKCPICPKGEEVTYSCLDTIIKKDQIHFTFKNIYLPGSDQKNVKDRDSTKGFVKYSMKFGNDFHKIKTKSKTSIFFDKNEPVITNYATTRFKPGLSVGAKTGYNLFPDLDNAKSYFVGATFCPFKSYRFYWQSEIYYTYLESATDAQTSPLIEDVFAHEVLLSNGTIATNGYSKTTSSSRITKNSIDVVPISLRYNLNNYIGVGVGPQFSVIMNERLESDSEKRFYYLDLNQPTPSQDLTEIPSLQENTSLLTTRKTFEKMQTSIFTDVTLGFARIGPSLGIRYYMNFEKNYNYWQFYGIWKF